jgi:ABC-type phosphate transport system auxiliary subunit
LSGVFAFWVGDKIVAPGSFWLWVLGIGVGIIIFLFLDFIFLFAISGFNHYFHPE